MSPRIYKNHRPKPICLAPGCMREREMVSTGFCYMHHRRYIRNGTTDRVHQKQNDKCCISGCNKKPTTKQMCPAHYTLWLRYGNPLHKRTMLPATRLKISRTTKGLPKSDDHIRKIMRSRGVKPTSIERELTAIIKEYHLPFRYCGNGDVIIGGKCPDYINTNGKKQLIEIFGNYWHDILDPARRAAFFSQYGFNTLIIWDEELKKKEVLIKKLKCFSNKKGV